MYIRDLGILGFWYLQKVLEPTPVDTKDQLHVHFGICSSVSLLNVRFRGFLVALILLE